MLRTLVNYIRKSGWFHKGKQMAEKTAVVDAGALKRPASPTKETKNKKFKKKNKEHTVQLGKSEGFKRKVAMMIAYNGAGYYGVQINPGFPTIESEFFPALVKVGGIPQDHADKPSQMWFQRGSRTDKGVSAAGQIFSLKVVLVPDLVAKLNEILPDQIRVMGYIRTTNGFDSKNFCCSRTYMYMMPTFAFAPIEKFISDDYRTTSAIIDRVREVLHRYIGTHKFHNFTSGVKFENASAARYMISFECSEPYIRDDIEFVTIRVKGQSFMLHQIRKMIGLTIAIVRGYCNESTIDAAWKPEKVDIPIAPGLGLVLEQLHFDGYNKKWGCDGVHEPVVWSSFKEQVEEFKEKFIISDIVATEKKEKVMMNWLQTLQFHNFNEPRTEGPQKPWAKTEKMLKAEKELKDGGSDNVQGAENEELGSRTNDATTAAADSEQGVQPEVKEATPNEPMTEEINQESSECQLSPKLKANVNESKKSATNNKGEDKSKVDQSNNDLSTL